jgi:stress-induced-phosphoprotein 1
MAILQDPVMQSILQQAKGDPRALQGKPERNDHPDDSLADCCDIDHMKNSGIRQKIQKLIGKFQPQIPRHQYIFTNN